MDTTARAFARTGGYLMKRILLKIFAVCAYWMGVDALFYKLNKPAKRIVTFHNVLPDEIFVGNTANGVSCSASAFRLIVRELRKRWKFSTDLFDAKTLTITFDDGYLNQYEVAAKILKEEGEIPAVLFASGDVTDGKTLVIDQILHWVSYAPKLVLRQLGYETAHDAWVKDLWFQFLADSKERGRGLLKRLDALCPYDQILTALSPEYRRLRLGGITKEQLDDLRRRGWVIGWHTKSHYPLSKLTSAEKRDEIAPPDEFKRAPFSFPYGEMQSVDEEAIKIAETCGYPCAVSNTTDPTPWHGCYFLPRSSLHADRYLLHFELSGCKYFLKYRKLLP